jgi:hypothetical protein
MARGSRTAKIRVTHEKKVKRAASIRKSPQMRSLGRDLAHSLELITLINKIGLLPAWNSRDESRCHSIVGLWQ